MPLIVAIEPDGRQAAQLTTLARSLLSVKLIVVDSTERAIAEIDRCVPDLILTSALLSGSDENALADRLRGLDAAAAHVQTVTIPVFAGPRHARGAKGVLARLRKSRKPANAPDGCDPKLFAEQIAQYLERAAAERALSASAKAEAEAEAQALADEARAAEVPARFQAEARVQVEAEFVLPAPVRDTFVSVHGSDDSPTIAESPVVEDPVVARLVETFYVEPLAKEVVLLAAQLGSVSPPIAIVAPPIEVVSPPTEAVSAPVVFVSPAIETVSPPVEVPIPAVQEAAPVEVAPPPAEMTVQPAEVVPPTAEPMHAIVEAIPQAVEAIPLATEGFLAPIELALPPTSEPICVPPAPEIAVPPTLKPINLEVTPVVDPVVITRGEAEVDLSWLLETTATAENDDEPITIEPLDEDALAEFGLNLSLTADATDDFVGAEISVSSLEPSTDMFRPQTVPILDQAQEPMAAIDSAAIVESTSEAPADPALAADPVFAAESPFAATPTMSTVPSALTERAPLPEPVATAEPPEHRPAEAELWMVLTSEPHHDRPQAEVFVAGRESDALAAPVAGCVPDHPVVEPISDTQPAAMAPPAGTGPRIEPSFVEDAIVAEELQPFACATSDTELWMALPLDWHRGWPRLDFVGAPLGEPGLSRIDLPIAPAFTRPIVFKAPEPPAGAISVPGATSRKKGRKAPRPVQDEWGMFDPEQCGLAALIAKLDEFTEVGDNTPGDDKA